MVEILKWKCGKTKLAVDIDFQLDLVSVYSNFWLIETIKTLSKILAHTDQLQYTQV